MADEQPNDLRYDEDGNLYRVEVELGPQRFVVHQQYEDGDGRPYDEGAAMVWEGPLYPTAPTKKYDDVLLKLRQEVADLQRQQLELTTAIRAAEIDGRVRLERLKQYRGLELLDLFLGGKITHYVQKDYGAPQIITFGQTEVSSGGWMPNRQWRLLTLYGNTKGELQWRLNHYADGSGQNMDVYPCTSLELAKSKWLELFYAHVAETQKPGSHRKPSQEWINAAKRDGIELPAEYHQAVEDQKRANLDKSLAEARAKLQELERELLP